MAKRYWNRRKWLSLGWLLIVALGLSTHARAQNAMALTILVRDTAGRTLAGVHVLVVPDREGAQPGMTMDMGTAHQITDAAGTARWPALPPGNYVVQFDTMVPLADGRPLQPVALQNRGTDDAVCSPLPGFCLRLDGVAAFTARFVLGGTAVADHTVPATPFWDLAARDTDPVRPVSPILGKELTAEQAAQQGGSFEIARSSPSPAMAARAHQAAAVQQERRTMWTLLGGGVLVELVLALGLVLRARVRRQAEAQEDAQL